MTDINNSSKNIPKIIYISGIDGSGKSTVSEYLAQQLRDRGYEVDILWLRFNNVLTKPLLGLCRLLGYTKYEDSDGIRVGYHNFYKSTIISYAFIMLQYLDAVRVKYTKILPNYGKSNKVLILDRYVYDILIDISVDIRNDELLNSWIGCQFVKLLPKDTLTLLVSRNLDKVLEVRPEGKVDRNFLSRFNQFEKLKNNSMIYTIDNTGTLEQMLDSTLELTGLKNES